MKKTMNNKPMVIITSPGILSQMKLMKESNIGQLSMEDLLSMDKKPFRILTSIAGYKAFEDACKEEYTLQLPADLVIKANPDIFESEEVLEEKPEKANYFRGEVSITNELKAKQSFAKKRKKRKNKKKR